MIFPEYQTIMWDTGSWCFLQVCLCRRKMGFVVNVADVEEVSGTKGKAKIA